MSDNGGVQPEPVKVRKSVIRKCIERTLSTAKYESIVIQDEIQEEIEWTTLEERQRKVANWETLLIQNFKGSQDRILEELGLSHKKAYFKDNLEKDLRTMPGDPQLDCLDTLE